MESFFVHFHSMENTWVGNSTLGIIWENYGDDLAIQIPYLLKIFWLSFGMDFIWESHFSFFKKSSSIFDLSFTYGIYMGSLITSVPHLVPVKTPLYLMVSSFTHNTRSMQCIQKQKKYLLRKPISQKYEYN